MLVESRGLLSDSTCFLEVKHGKLDIKRYEHGVLFISFKSWVTLQTRDYDVICLVSTSVTMSFKMCSIMMT